MADAFEPEVLICALRHTTALIAGADEWDAREILCACLGKGKLHSRWPCCVSADLHGPVGPQPCFRRSAEPFSSAIETTQSNAVIFLTLTVSPT